MFRAEFEIDCSRNAAKLSRPVPSFNGEKLKFYLLFRKTWKTKEYETVNFINENSRTMTVRLLVRCSGVRNEQQLAWCNTLHMLVNCSVLGSGKLLARCNTLYMLVKCSVLGSRQQLARCNTLHMLVKCSVLRSG